MRPPRMGPLLHGIARAYRPLAGRNGLVEGPHRLPWPASAPRPRMTLLALVAGWLGQRP